jgi:GTP-binding protein
MAKSRNPRLRNRKTERDPHDRTGRKGPRRAAEAFPDEMERDPRARPPVVAIVGRPNVGKSTLLNALARSRIAIVEETPGVTRDRVSVIATLADRTVLLVDTGGVGIVDQQGLQDDVEGQVARAVTEADVILFLVDAREGLMPLDRRVAKLLRKADAPVILLANKAESERVQWALGEFEALGLGTPLTISAKERMNLPELEDRIEVHLPEGATTPRKLDAPEMKLAFVGRMNAGKSSLVNALLKDERMIVSDVPGTTRDTVDVRFESEGRAIVVIDTAGIRKERIVHDSVDFYAQRRAERAMRRADVTALVLDASVEVGRLDRKIAAYAVEHYRPMVIVANKWDLKPDGLSGTAFRKYLRGALPGLRFAPVVFVSALKGTGVHAFLKIAWRLQEQASTRIATAQINKVIEAAQTLRGPRTLKGRQGLIYYGTQVSTLPPTFALFANDPELFDDAYRRYLENRFREALPFSEIPLKLIFRKRQRDSDEASS